LRKRAAIVLSALTVAVVAGGVATWQTGIAGKLARLSAGDSLLPAARPPHLGNMKPLTGEDQLEIDPAISPDGKSVAYAAGTATHVRIYIRSVGGGPARPLREATTLQFQPRWSPDGTRMLYISPEGVFVAPVDGGAAQQILSRTDVPEKDIVVRMRSGISAAAWGPDGQRVAIADNSDRSLSLVSVDDGRRQVIATSQHELHSCDWSPDGKWIACTSGNWHFAGVGWTFGNAAPSAIVLVPAAGGDLIELTDRLARNSSPTWARDSTTLLFVSDSQGASDVYSLEVGEDGQPRGGATRITTGLNAYSIHFSAGGDRLVYAAFSARANIWSMPIPSSVADASAADPVTRGNQTIESMRVSRDGKWLLYDSNLNGSFDIFRVPIGGGPVERLTTDPGDEFVPDLSPDGQRLAYHSWRTKTRDIFVQLLDGGPPEQVTATSSHEAFPVWSPDGQSLAFVDLSEERGVFRGAFLTRRDEVGRWGTPVALRVGAWKVFWSPDGRFLAYSRGDAVEVVFPETGASRIVYAPASHSAQPKAEDVLVGADGRTLYFKSHDAEGRASIWSVPLAGGTPRLLVKFDDPTRRSSRTDFAVGGGRFFFAIDDHRSNIWVADVAVN
jgi:Tol biopolymer transport system component